MLRGRHVALPTGTGTDGVAASSRPAVSASRRAGTATATEAAQHRRPGVVYRPVRDAPPVQVWLAWWADTPPPDLDALVQLVTEQYARQAPRGAARPVVRGRP